MLKAPEQGAFFFCRINELYRHIEIPASTGLSVLCRIIFHVVCLFMGRCKAGSMGLIVSMPLRKIFQSDLRICLKFGH
ncbi:hypothetical protein THS27_14475 [Thalassospira sp. MCCC 1A01428]|nr:hypothetical protein THS27_14475 [Thalassospira sp. MCCC 1A01428]